MVLNLYGGQASISSVFTKLFGTKPKYNLRLRFTLKNYNADQVSWFIVASWRRDIMDLVTMIFSHLSIYKLPQPS